MNYNFYDRKDDLVPKEQLDWIDANIEIISNTEIVLFVFQAEYEALLFTNSNIYFPNRNTKRLISYDEIANIRIAGDLHLELKTRSNEVYSIILVSAIDKVKIFQVLKLLIENQRNGKNTSFADTHLIFDKFTVLKYPPNQLQHKLPQVYLKQFGYIDNKQWKVSILQKGEKFCRQKSIGSFTAETNVFDIDSEDDRFPRMFESLNADLENLYPDVLEDISNNSNLSDKSWEIIVQLIPNLMVRSDHWRDFVREIMGSDRKETFLEITLSIHTKSDEERQELKKKDFYRILNESELTTSILNKTLLHFLNYLSHQLQSFDIVVLQAPKGNELFTSDNPVTFRANQIEGKMGLFSDDTYLYFPLSKDYLIYMHHRNSTKGSPLRKLENRKIYQAEEILTEQQYTEIVRNKIIKNSEKLIIVPGEMKYKIEK